MRALHRTSFQLAAAFAVGVAAAPWLGQALPGARAQPAAAAPALAEVSTLKPLLIDLAALTDADLTGAPGADLRSKALVVTDNATLAVQTGNPPKHHHAKSDEIQYIVEGSGTAWFGDRQVDIHPGMLLVIPKGMAHGGTAPVSGRFKSIAIKIPPQQAGDVVPEK